MAKQELTNEQKIKIASGIQALADKVMVEFEPRQERETKSGILVAAPKHEGMPVEGLVLAIGPLVEEIEVGDYVRYEETSPNGFHYKGLSIIPVSAKNVAAKILERDEA